jgi:hypothetical protein
MYPRSLREEVGDFEEYFNDLHGEDRYWGMHALRHGPALILSDELYSYRVRKGSVTNTFVDERRLIVVRLLEELERQRFEEGSDYLERSDLQGLEALEKTLLLDRELVAGELRTWAARTIDQENHAAALRLLASSFRKSPFNPGLSRTALYLVRNYLRHVFAPRDPV